jgi:hypothetical protein
MIIIIIIIMTTIIIIITIIITISIIILHSLQLIMIIVIIIIIMTGEAMLPVEHLRVAPAHLLSPPALGEGGKAGLEPRRTLWMPVSLCRRAALPVDLWYRALELPSIIWRLESLLLAHRLAARLLPPEKMV